LLSDADAAGDDVADNEDIDRIAFDEGSVLILCSDLTMVDGCNCKCKDPS